MMSSINRGADESSEVQMGALRTEVQFRAMSISQLVLALLFFLNISACICTFNLKG